MTAVDVYTVDAASTLSPLAGEKANSWAWRSQVLRICKRGANAQTSPHHAVIPASSGSPGQAGNDGAGWDDWCGERPRPTSARHRPSFSTRRGLRLRHVVEE